MGAWYTRLYGICILLILAWYVLELVKFPLVVGLTHDMLVAVGPMWIVLGVLLIMTILLFFAPARSTKVHSFVKATPTGEVRIGFAAVRDVASRTARQISGVDRLKTTISDTEGGLVISMRIRATAGVNLTDMSETIQARVMDAVKNATSLSVYAVHVQVSELSPEPAKA
ncbi:Asp23/Gls24 family envelope stress response protein [Ferroacidibacillus organovorans]|uniref:Alkaline shock response membrane anchor protein AmaP n=1 Tax=Ferroacidibacillus organovorans TaxID=1765683 RepID=A0A1V4EU51_9BACL|nr:Asp23/Gls24 family envelope stress response protein [Ferroacidibacillus organovorans]OPG16466.1 hypothetical protein B2M26_06195 [Ferroacidibacillus organovorans]